MQDVDDVKQAGVEQSVIVIWQCHWSAAVETYVPTFEPEEGVLNIRSVKN